MSRKILLLKNGEIAPTPNLTFALLGISSRECFFGTPGKRSRQIKKFRSIVPYKQLGKLFLIVLNDVAFPTRGSFLESPDRFLFYLGRVCKVQSFNNSENDAMKLSVKEAELIAL